MALLLVAQSLLVGLTLNYESSRLQEQTDQVAADVAMRARQIAGRDLHGLQNLLWKDPATTRWRPRATTSF